MEVADLVARALAGDGDAWSDLVDRFGGLVWSVARSVGLSGPDAADVSQTTWLRFAEHLGDLQDSSRAGAWLATTARREAIRVSRLGDRHVLVDPWEWLDRPAVAADEVDAGLLGRERDLLVQYGFAALSERCRRLLGAVTTDPPVPYGQISEMLGMPMGSIGPTRARCLEHLGRLIEEISGELMSDRTQLWNAP